MPGDFRRAGEDLRDLWLSAATMSLEPRSAEIERLTGFYMKAPDDPSAAVALTLLALTRLAAYVEHDLNLPFFSAYGEYRPLPRPDDEHARTLAAEVIARAGRARGLDPADNLGAFAEGLAHELRGETDRAVDAYREALRLDQNDHPAVARLELLTGEEFEGPDEDPVCPHAGAFYVLDMMTPAREDGTCERIVLLSTDAAEIRAEADAYFATRPHTHDTLDYSVETHIPGEESVSDFLLMALEDGPDGHPVIDWAAVEMPELEGPPLPEGRPVRENGELLFFGRSVSELEAVAEAEAED